MILYDDIIIQMISIVQDTARLVKIQKFKSSKLYFPKLIGILNILF